MRPSWRPGATRPAALRHPSRPHPTAPLPPPPARLLAHMPAHKMAASASPLPVTSWDGGQGGLTGSPGGCPPQNHLTIRGELSLTGRCPRRRPATESGRSRGRGGCRRGGQPPPRTPAVGHGEGRRGQGGAGQPPWHPPLQVLRQGLATGGGFPSPAKLTRSLPPTPNRVSGPGEGCRWDRVTPALATLSLC